MDNPFSIIDQRLENIERCLHELLTIRSRNDESLLLATDECLSVDQLADYLGCVKATVLRYKRNGVIPFYQAGRIPYFKKSEVDAALTSKRRK